MSDEAPGSGAHNPAGRLTRAAAAAIPDLALVLSRFPVPAAIALAFTVYLLADLQTGLAAASDFRQRVPMLAVLSFLATTAAHLLGEGLGWSRTWGKVGALAAAAVVTAAVADADRIGLSPGLLGFAGLVAIGLTPHARPSADPAAYWLFNHQIGIALATAIIAGLLLPGGVSIILATLQYLFSIPVDAWLVGRVWILGLALLAPLTFLHLIPAQLDARVVEGRQVELTSYAVALLVRFILAPLLVAYAVILHVYAVKIGFDGVLPKGRIGWIVMSFGAAMTATALLTFPSRASGSRVVELFWRAWPWLLPVPTVLLFLAAFERIRQYGLTEQRYLLLLAGLWLMLLALAMGLRRARDIRFIAASLATLLLLAAAGPWGMIEWSVRQQTRELVARLTAAGAVVEGKAPEPQRSAVTLLPEDQRRVGDILRYLAERAQIDRLRPIFAGRSLDPFLLQRQPMPPHVYPHLAEILRRRRFLTGDDNARIADILRRLGIAQSPALAGFNQKSLQFRQSHPHVLMLSGRLVIGPLHGWDSTPSRPRPVATAVLPDGKLKVVLDGGFIAIAREPNGPSARFDVAGSADVRARMRVSESGATLPSTSFEAPVVLKPVSGDLVADMVIVGATAVDDGAARLTLRSVQFYLMVAP